MRKHNEETVLDIKLAIDLFDCQKVFSNLDVNKHVLLFNETTS